MQYPKQDPNVQSSAPQSPTVLAPGRVQEPSTPAQPQQQAATEKKKPSLGKFKVAARTVMAAQETKRRYDKRKTTNPRESARQRTKPSQWSLLRSQMVDCDTTRTVVKTKPEKLLWSNIVAKTALTTPNNNNSKPMDIKGVSVYHLKHDFLEQLVCKVSYNGVDGPLLSRESKIYEIENLQGPPGIVRRTSAKEICPVDGKEGASYVHCLRGEDHVADANYMLSYTWG